MTLGAYIEGYNYCIECASEELSDVLAGNEIRQALRLSPDSSSYTYHGYTRVFDTFPVRYNKQESIAVYLDEDTQLYCVASAQFQDNNPELAYHVLDVKEASTRTFSETGLERLNRNDLIYVCLVDDKLEIVADSDFTGDNDEKSTYVVDLHHEVTERDIRIINEIVESHYRDGISLYNDNNTGDDLDGLYCENESRCENAAKQGIGQYYFVEPYNTTCGCTGCDKCTKRDEHGACGETAATGWTALIAEEEYSWENRRCKNCQLEQLTTLDDTVIEYVTYLWWKANGKRDDSSKVYLDAILLRLNGRFACWHIEDMLSSIKVYWPILLQIMAKLAEKALEEASPCFAYWYYDELSQGISLTDETENTPRAQVVKKIEEVYGNAEIALDECLFFEYVEQLDNDEQFKERERSRQYNNRVEKHNKKYCKCPIHTKH